MRRYGRRVIMVLALVLLAGFFNLAAAEVLVIPHLTGGFDRWRDTLTLDNFGPSPTRVTVALYDNDGKSVYFGSHQIGAYGETVLNLKQFTPNASIGTVTLLNQSPVRCRVALECIAGGGVAEFLLGGVQGEKLAFLFGDFPMVQWKGVALANSSFVQGKVTLYALGGGRLLASASYDLLPHRKLMGAVKNLFPGLDYHAVKKIVAVSTISTLAGVAIAGDGTNARLLFTAAVPLAGFTVPAGGGGEPGGGSGGEPGGDLTGNFIGTWRGSWMGSHGYFGILEMELGQAGNMVSGPGRMTGTHCGDLNDIPFAGPVADNLVTLDSAFICSGGDPAGYGELTFTQERWAGNTISGTWREIFNGAPIDSGTFSLTRQ